MSVTQDGIDMYSAENRENLEEILYQWFQDPSVKKNRQVFTVNNLQASTV
jgi:hypothetical protein